MSQSIDHDLKYEEWMIAPSLPTNDDKDTDKSNLDSSKTMLEMSTDQLAQQQVRIDDVEHALPQTTKIANHSTRFLEVQGETIERQTQRITQIGDRVQQSRSLLSRMNRQEWIGSICLVGVFICLALVIMVVIWIKLFPSAGAAGGNGNGSK
jgi:hypothetical protein